MIEQGFHIGKRKWWVMVYYDVRTESELARIADALRAAGERSDHVDDAIANLRGWNRGSAFPGRRRQPSPCVPPMPG